VTPDREDVRTADALVAQKAMAPVLQLPEATEPISTPLTNTVALLSIVPSTRTSVAAAGSVNCLRTSMSVPRPQAVWTDVELLTGHGPPLVPNPA
jgi:hypothetical protein